MPIDYINDRESVVKLLSKHLKGEKFKHSIGVEETAIWLAEQYGADPVKAGLAGLLHDITKQRDNRELAARYGLDFIAEKTLHGPTASCWLKEKGYVEDDEVLLAIKYHTTGRADMTLLEKIIYLADYIEPNRDFEEVDVLRDAVHRDLNEGLLLGLEMSLKDILERENLIDPDSVSAYNCYSLQKRFNRTI